MRTNVRAVSDTLKAEGIRHLFGLMGNGNLELIADLIDRHGVAYSAMRHESAVVAAADGYARAGRRLGVATVTHGPGFTNALTALQTASKARSPLLLIAGNASGYTGRSTQRLDQRRVLEAFDIPVVAPDPDDDWAAATRQAIALSLEGAAVLDLPAEAMRLPARKAAEPEVVPPSVAPVPDPSLVEQAAQILSGARRPLILAGKGAARAGMGDALANIGQRLGAPLSTTLAACGLFSRMPGNVGMMGGLGTPMATQAGQGADVVLVAGASLNGFTTDNGRLMGRGRIVRLDADPAAPSSVPVELTVIGELQCSVAALLGALVGPDRRDLWLTGQPEPAPPADSVEDVFAAIEKSFPKNRTVVFDHGDLPNRSIAFIQVDDPSRMIFMTDFGSLGLALGAAAGAALACPDRRTLAVVGDGGALMQLGELDSLRRLAVPVTIVVLNNGAYAAELPHLAEIGASIGPARFDSAPISQMARAIGIASAQLDWREAPSRLPEYLSTATAPFLIEIMFPQPQ